VIEFYQSSSLMRLRSMPIASSIGGTSETIDAGPHTKHNVSGLSTNGVSCVAAIRPRAPRQRAGISRVAVVERVNSPRRAMARNSGK